MKAFRIVAPNGGHGARITNDLDMGELARVAYAHLAWNIKEYHQALKPYTEVERCPARLARSQRNHTGFALRAFLQLEWHRYTTGVTWFEAKWRIIRAAVAAYLVNPIYNLLGSASA